GIAHPLGEDIAPGTEILCLGIRECHFFAQLRCANGIWMPALGSASPMKSGHVQCNRACLFWANSGLMQRSKTAFYSNTSPAIESGVGEPRCQVLAPFEG